jgi:beta-glucosidase
MPDQAFPDAFRWGTATAAHQVDGGTWNNDWWAWEHDPSSPCSEPSGDACDHWNRWPADIRMLAELGFGSYRFSLEWSRIEPEEGEFSTVALDHYKAMCEGCRELGLDPVVTFHHFTSPRWVAAAGGWAEPATAERFARFCERSAAHLGDLMGAACTINEPNVVSFYGYRGGVFPPGERSSERRHQANHVFIEGHQRAVAAIRGVAPGVPVGLTLSMTDFQAVDGGEERVERMRSPMEDVFLHATDGDDFVGVQTYTRMLV